MLHSQKEKEKKAAGSGEPTKETRFIHKVTHIHKNELRRQALPTASNSPPQKNTLPNISLWHPSSIRTSAPPEVLSPLKTRSDPKSSARLQHLSIPRPPHPFFFLFHHPQAAVLMLSYFSRIAMQPDALSLLGVGVGGLGVRFPQPETCKAFISSWPTPNPGGCTCLCHLTPPGAGVGVHHSQTFPLSCFSPLLPAAKICRVPLLASLQVPSGLSGL